MDTPTPLQLAEMDPGDALTYFEGGHLAGHDDPCICPSLLGQVANRLAGDRDRLPYQPPGLRDIIDTLAYKPGWEFALGLFKPDETERARGWAFYVTSDTRRTRTTPRPDPASCTSS